MHQAMAAALDGAFVRDPVDPAGSAGREIDGAAALADDRPAQPQGLDWTEDGRWPEDGGLLAGPPGAVHLGQARAPADPRRLDAQLQAGGAVRRGWPVAPGNRRPGPRGRAPDERQPPCERRRADAPAAAAALRGLCGERRRARPLGRRSHQGHGGIPARCDAEERRNAKLSGFRTRRDGVQPTAGSVRGDRPSLGRRDDAGRRRAPQPGRAGDGDPQRTHLPGLARRLSADRPPRPLQLLRGLHPHRQLDVQPARQVAEDRPGGRMAPSDRVAQLSLDLPRLAPGPQRLQPPGSRVRRSRRQQEGRHCPGLFPAGREHLAVRHRPLPAQLGSHQRHRRGKAAAAAMARYGHGDQALHRGHRHLGLGEQRRAAASPTW